MYCKYPFSNVFNTVTVSNLANMKTDCTNKTYIPFIITYILLSGYNWLYKLFVHIQWFFILPLLIELNTGAVVCTESIFTGRKMPIVVHKFHFNPVNLLWTLLIPNNSPGICNRHNACDEPISWVIASILLIRGLNQHLISLHLH